MLRQGFVELSHDPLVEMLTNGATTSGCTYHSLVSAYITTLSVVLSALHTLPVIRVAPASGVLRVTVGCPTVVEVHPPFALPPAVIPPPPHELDRKSTRL